MTDVPLVASLLVAAIGMVIVFLAMGLIYASMRLLTAVATGRSGDDSACAPPLASQDRTETPWQGFYRRRQLRPGGRGRIA